MKKATPLTDCPPSLSLVFQLQHQHAQNVTPASSEPTISAPRHHQTEDWNVYGDEYDMAGAL